MMDATSVVAQLEVAPAGVPPVALVNTATLLAMLANAGEAVDCAIRKAQGIQAGLDELAANEALSLSQLRANWVAAPAALQFHAARRAQTHAAIEVVFDAADIQVSVLFHCQGNAVVAAATAKRVGLEGEAVAADAALEMAIAAKKELQAKAAVAPVDAPQQLYDPAALLEVDLGLFAAAQAAVRAIPEHPVTSRFLAVEPAPAPEVIHADTAELLAAHSSVWLSEAPAGLTCGQAARLQAWIPPGGTSLPSEWQDVYRGTSDGFGAADFHRCCDNRPRLLVLVRAQDSGWLFGGYTEVGFADHGSFYADSASFLYSLSNALGHPEKLASLQTGLDLCYNPAASASFGDGLGFHICSNANTGKGSYTFTGHSYTKSASRGTPDGSGDAERLACCRGRGVDCLSCQPVSPSR